MQQKKAEKQLPNEPEKERKLNVDELLSRKVAEDQAKLKTACAKFTGEVLSFIYRPHLGFADYAIVKLRLKDGIVEEVVEVSDPLAAFEARAHMETKQAYLLEKMRTKYPPEFRHV